MTDPAPCLHVVVDATRVAVGWRVRCVACSAVFDSANHTWERAKALR